ncbi:MAG: tRNA (adenosine(37)-N6)-dimethylallyltransferase MiaA [bacterium]|nr:tRNA (adenosine(37)-N6)-dimethylallyltransferase MiaA [bacterium]
MAQQKVLVILGPTASGKSDLAVRLAKRFGGEIISADSRQVYKGLDIGTGKITKQEMRGVPHHLLDVVNPRKQFSASKYKKLADEKVRYIAQKHKLPIVVGGTGFYIDALTGRANFPEVGPNLLLRKKLEKKTASELFRMLNKKDPRRAGAIDLRNKVRVIRALEIVEALGKVPQASPKPLEPSPFIYIGLKPDNLDGRIHKRLIERLDGMIREGKKLHTQGLTYKRMHQLGLEYRYVGMYLQGKLSREEMVDKLYIEIKRYAKRQMTWFKRNKKIRWFKPEEYKKIERLVNVQLNT